MVGVVSFPDFETNCVTQDRVTNTMWRRICDIIPDIGSPGSSRSEPEGCKRKLEKLRKTQP